MEILKGNDSKPRVMFQSKDKPCWYQFRWRLSNALVSLARKVYPENPEVKAFWMDVMMDQIIYGKSVVRVDPGEMSKGE